jgi:hypothetical protein
MNTMLNHEYLKVKKIKRWGTLTNENAKINFKNTNKSVLFSQIQNPVELTLMSLVQSGMFYFQVG